MLCAAEFGDDRTGAMAHMAADNTHAGLRASGDETAQVAAYVAELAGSLALIARQHGLDALGYILDMAQMEAENATRYANGRR